MEDRDKVLGALIILLILAFLFMAATALEGDGEGGIGPGGEGMCSGSEDCPEGQVCVNGLCTSPEGACIPSCNPPLVCYAGSCMSQGEADCISMGGTWNPATQSCDTAASLGCEASGGIWIPNPPPGFCECPLGTSWDIVAQECVGSSQLGCEQSGGTWIPEPPPGECDCSEGYQWDGVSCVINDEALCTSTGGTWIEPDGPCECPAGQIFVEECPEGEEECETGCVPEPCTSESGCTDDCFICVDNLCNYDLCCDVECPEGQVCVDGECVIPVQLPQLTLNPSEVWIYAGQLGDDECEGCPDPGSMESRMFLEPNFEDETLGIVLFVEPQPFNRTAVVDGIVFVRVIANDPEVPERVCRLLTNINGEADLDYSSYDCGATGCTIKFVFCCADMGTGCLLPVCLEDDSITDYLMVPACEGATSDPWPMQATVNNNFIPIFPVIEDIIIPKEPTGIASAVSFELCFPLLVIFGLLSAAMFAAGRNPFQMFSLYNPRFKRSQGRMMRARGRTWNIKAIAGTLASTVMTATNIATKKTGLSGVGRDTDSFASKVGLGGMSGKVAKTRMARRKAVAGARGDTDTLKALRRVEQADQRAVTSGAKGDGAVSITNVDTGVMALDMQDMNFGMQMLTSVKMMGMLLGIKMMEGMGLSVLTYGAGNLEGIRTKATKALEAKAGASLFSRGTAGKAGLVQAEANAKLTGNNDIGWKKTMSFTNLAGEEITVMATGATQEECETKFESLKMGSGFQDSMKAYDAMEIVGLNCVAPVLQEARVKANEEFAESIPEAVSIEVNAIEKNPEKLQKHIANVKAGGSGAADSAEVIAAYVYENQDSMQIDYTKNEAGEVTSASVTYGDSNVQDAMNAITGYVEAGGPVASYTASIDAAADPSKAMGEEALQAQRTAAAIQVINTNEATFVQNEVTTLTSRGDLKMDPNTYRPIEGEGADYDKYMVLNGLVNAENQEAQQYQHLVGAFENEGKALLEGKSNLLSSPIQDKVEAFGGISLSGESKDELTKMTEEYSKKASYEAYSAWDTGRKEALADAQRHEHESYYYEMGKAHETLKEGGKVDGEAISNNAIFTDIIHQNGGISGNELERRAFIEKALQARMGDIDYMPSDDRGKEYGIPTSKAVGDVMGKIFSDVDSTQAALRDFGEHYAAASASGAVGGNAQEYSSAPEQMDGRDKSSGTTRKEIMEQAQKEYRKQLMLGKNPREEPWVQERANELVSKLNEKVFILNQGAMDPNFDVGAFHKAREHAAKHADTLKTNLQPQNPYVSRKERLSAAGEAIHAFGEHGRPPPPAFNVEQNNAAAAQNRASAIYGAVGRFKGREGKVSKTFREEVKREEAVRAKQRDESRMAELKTQAHYDYSEKSTRKAIDDAAKRSEGQKYKDEFEADKYGKKHPPKPKEPKHDYAAVKERADEKIRKAEEQAQKEVETKKKRQEEYALRHYGTKTPLTKQEARKRIEKAEAERMKGARLEARRRKEEKAAKKQTEAAQKTAKNGERTPKENQLRRERKQLRTSRRKRQRQEKRKRSR